MQKMRVFRAIKALKEAGAFAYNAAGTRELSLLTRAASTSSILLEQR